MAIGRIPEPGTGIPESIVDAKGDIVTATAADTPARLAVGTNDHRLVAASGEATGLKYVADTQNTVVDAKGDLLVGTAADTIARLAVGTNGYTLVADSTETTGLKWQAPAGGGGPYAGARIGTNQTLSAATVTKLNFDTEDWDSDNCYNTTDKRFTPNKSGKYQVIAHVVMYDGPEYRLLIYKNGAEDCLLDIVDYTINDLNPILQGTKTISMNGTTDYLEIYGFMRAGSTRRVNAGGSWFQISYIGA